MLISGRRLIETVASEGGGRLHRVTASANPASHLRYVVKIRRLIESEYKRKLLCIGFSSPGKTARFHTPLRALVKMKELLYTKHLKAVLAGQDHFFNVSLGTEIFFEKIASLTENTKQI